MLQKLEQDEAEAVLVAPLFSTQPNMVPLVTTDDTRSTENITSSGRSFTPPQSDPPPTGKMALDVFQNLTKKLDSQGLL